MFLNRCSSFEDCAEQIFCEQPEEYVCHQRTGWLGFCVLSKVCSERLEIMKFLRLFVHLYRYDINTCIYIVLLCTIVITHKTRKYFIKKIDIACSSDQCMKQMLLRVPLLFCRLREVSPSNLSRQVSSISTEDVGLCGKSRIASHNKVFF